MIFFHSGPHHHIHHVIQMDTVGQTVSIVIILHLSIGVIQQGPKVFQHILVLRDF